MGMRIGNIACEDFLGLNARFSKFIKKKKRKTTRN